MVLISGTALGHGITAAALPFLSRLYTPTDFSMLAVFASLVSIISVCACLRFDVAIALPESDDIALTLLVMSLGLAFLTALITLALVLIAPEFIAQSLKQPQLHHYLALLPPTIFLAGAYNALLAWFVREKKFSLISKSRVAQSAVAAGVQLGTGLYNASPAGLLFGYSMNTGAACIALGYSLAKDKLRQSMIRSISRHSIKNTFRTYDRYPKYSTFEALFNSGSMQLPVLFIAALAAPQELGYLLMATFVMQAPTALIGTSIGQVYLSQAADKHRAGELEKFTSSVILGLTKAGAPPLVAVGLISPFVFGLIFGSEWDRSGLLVLWMTPWFIMQFITAPVSMSLHVTGNQSSAVWIQVFGLVIRLGAVLAASVVAPERIVECYALSGAVFYAIYLYIVMRKVKLATIAHI